MIGTSRVFLVHVRSGDAASACTPANRAEWEREKFYPCPAVDGPASTYLFTDQTAAARYALRLEEDFGWHTKVLPFNLVPVPENP